MWKKRFELGFVQTSLTSGCCAKKCDRTRSKGIGKGKNQTIMNVINLYISLLCFFHVKCSIDSVFSTWEQLVVFRFKFVSFVNKKIFFSDQVLNWQCLLTLGRVGGQLVQLPPVCWTKHDIWRVDNQNYYSTEKRHQLNHVSGVWRNITVVKCQDCKQFIPSWDCWQSRGR